MSKRLLHKTISQYLKVYDFSFFNFFEKLLKFYCSIYHNNLICFTSNSYIHLLGTIYFFFSVSIIFLAFIKLLTFPTAEMKDLPPSTTKETMNNCLNCSSVKNKATEDPTEDPIEDPTQTAAAIPKGVEPLIPRVKADVRMAGRVLRSMVP